MSVARLQCGLRELRVKAGLQQRELAARVGVSRQTLGALEAGETVPATSIALQLARVLGCRVEDIFWLGEDDSPIEALLVGPGAAASPDGARVAVASVDDRWVAHLLDGASPTALVAPADGVLTGARRLTPRGPVRVRPLRDAKALRENLFAAGCDPALALLASHVGERWQTGRMHWLEAGSSGALDLLAERHVHLCGVHLFDEESGEHNVGAVRRRLHGQPMVLINLAVWEQGLVLPPGNPKKIRGVVDLGRKGVRVVGREPGAGAHELLLRTTAAAGVPRKAVDIVATAHGHLAVAQLVASGHADTGISTRAAAACHGLGLVPLGEARFDLVLAREAAADARLARVLDVLASPRFRRDLGCLAGYGTSRTGQVVAEVSG